MLAVIGTLDKVTFGLRLAELRERSGFSQADVVRRASGAFKQSHYSQWENGVMSPNAQFVPAIATALDCEIWELFEEPTAGFVPTPSKFQRRGE